MDNDAFIFLGEMVDSFLAEFLAIMPFSFSFKFIWTEGTHL